MLDKGQKQEAGDGSQQLQVGGGLTVNNGVLVTGNATFNNGITVDELKQIKEIFNIQHQYTYKEITDIAFETADKRIGEFEKRFEPRIIHIENALLSFADPAFQILLRHAQLSAASTEREADYDLLT